MDNFIYDDLIIPFISRKCDNNIEEYAYYREYDPISLIVLDKDFYDMCWEFLIHRRYKLV
jgi:hypothetical protein